MRNSLLRLLAGIGITFVGVVSFGQTRPAITGIAFVRMYTSDMAASDAFYSKTLGYEKVEGTDGISRFGVNRLQWIEVQPLPAAKPQKLVAMVALRTRNVAQMKKYLTAHHVAVTGKLHDGFTVNDPEGNVVGFVGPGALGSIYPQSTHAASHRIIHSGFVVTDRKIEDTFYIDTLGFHVFWHGGRNDDASTDWVSIQVPEGTDWVEYMLNLEPNANAHTLGSRNHFSLGIATMSDAVAALGKNGCSTPQCSKTQIGRDGKVQLNLYDPDLTRVEFMEFKPSATPCCSQFTGNPPSEEEDK